MTCKPKTDCKTLICGTCGRCIAHAGHAKDCIERRDLMRESEAAASARIRAELRKAPGARDCGIGNCQVITQGGLAGLNRHRQYVHADEAWLTSDTEEST